jgi:hypothetical protein
LVTERTWCMELVRQVAQLLMLWNKRGSRSCLQTSCNCQYTRHEASVLCPTWMASHGFLPVGSCEAGTKLKLYDRRSVDQSSLSEAQDQIFVTVSQLRVCWCGALSLTTERICRLQLLLVRVPRDSWPYFTVSDSRLPQPGGSGPRVYIPQEQGGPVISAGTGFRFRRLLRLGRATVEVFEPASTRAWNWISQGQSYFTTGGLPPISSSWCQAPWDSRPEIFSTEPLQS